MKKIIACFLLSIFFISNAHAASVYAKDRNIYYADNGAVKQLTSLGRDEDPKLHPKGEWVYFIRSTPGRWEGEKYYPAKGEIVKDGILKYELWRIKINGTGGTMLFRPEHSAVDGPDPDYSTASVNNIQFSPDGDKIYFEASEWVTSEALYVMNADGSGIKMLGDGNDTKIVLSSRTFEDRERGYKGYIVTCQHRYFFFGGSYDWYYLYTPDLKREIAPLGEDFDYFTDVGEMKYTDHSEENIKKVDYNVGGAQ